jgi:hypothetical protein
LQAINVGFQFPLAQCGGNTSINFRRCKSGYGFGFISQWDLEANYLTSLSFGFLLCKMKIIIFSLLTLAELL